jgi:hypothetical protein
MIVKYAVWYVHEKKIKEIKSDTNLWALTKLRNL